MQCKHCRDKGKNPFCVYCLMPPKVKKRLTAAEYQALKLEKDLEEAAHQRRMLQEKQLEKMMTNMEKANIDTSGVQFMLDNNV